MTAVTTRDGFEALVWRIAGRRLDPREIGAIVRAAEAWRGTARYRDDVRPCGTVAAYHRHLRRGEPPCASCLEAVAAAAREARASRRLAAVPDTPDQPMRRSA